MKTSIKPLFALLLCLASAVAFSQVKTAVFTQYPQEINIQKSQLGLAFTKGEGEKIIIPLSNDFIISGIVITNIQKYHNLHSMTIRLDGYSNSVFHLSKILKSDNTEMYVGRILGTEATDGFEIKNDVAGNYKLKKIKEENLRQICSQ
ncbi:MAG: hypothetical protein ABIO05_03790 [Ferruginibacter sp.]